MPKRKKVRSRFWSVSVVRIRSGSEPTHYRQCCGSGSGIRDWVPFWPLDQDRRKSATGSGIRDEEPGSYFLELRNHIFAFFGVKILEFFDEDPGSGMETVRIRDPGWKKVGSGIRDGDSSDPPHWLRMYIIGGQYDFLSLFPELYCNYTVTHIGYENNGQLWHSVVNYKGYFFFSFLQKQSGSIGKNEGWDMDLDYLINEYSPVSSSTRICAGLAVLGIRIHRSRMFFGLPDPDPYGTH